MDQQPRDANDQNSGGAPQSRLHKHLSGERQVSALVLHIPQSTIFPLIWLDSFQPIQPRSVARGCEWGQQGKVRLTHITAKVASVIRAAGGAFMCVTCICERLGTQDTKTKKTVHRVTSELSTGAYPEFSKCTLCGARAVGCRANDRLVWA